MAAAAAAEAGDEAAEAEDDAAAAAAVEWDPAVKPSKVVLLDASDDFLKGWSWRASTTKTRGACGCCCGGGGDGGGDGGS